ncbi:hypothetical protein OYC64_001299 [Pagothenia borchgrevinki]|uniref:Uncharacterized protein n=1 Tax=Pagothenia borchgrevinki TaxID=8213 RepID=A0ABD2GA31_PAGBO
MSCRYLVLLLLFLRVHSSYLTPDPYDSFPGFEFPEIDGSPVDPCRVILLTTPAPETTAITNKPIIRTTTRTTKPITQKQVVATTKKPAVQSQPRKPDTRNPGTPIRKQPAAPAKPITHSLLFHLLTNSRGSFISQPMGRLPPRGYGSSSDSSESRETLVKRAGRTNRNQWRTGSSSSEDSSDES